MLEVIEIERFLSQSNISNLNIARLRVLAASPHAANTRLADLVLRVALVKPHKRRRLRFLALRAPGLLQELRAAGLVVFDADSDDAGVDSFDDGNEDRDADNVYGNGAYGDVESGDVVWDGEIPF
ncbi:hypothetical protein C7S18_04545 [Ahniella affigens]|uniref:Uncharacterized protein n=1 Tax=Ahniella affigens TaxID=2021234 RepID=A0A2P1PNU0_9GAMM|nr:hypothetical protein C7S18_04545 [Ahniella affigens]